MNLESKSSVIIPAEELACIKSTLAQILKVITELKSAKQPDWIGVKNITALELMKAFRIKRTKFDQLVNENRIKVIKKKQKIYGPVSEIDWYFNDPSVQYRFICLAMPKPISCKKTNQVDLVDYLSSLGFAPEKIRGSDYWYLSRLRDEKTASFKSHRNRNICYDHGLGKGETVIDFGKEYSKCSISAFLIKMEIYKGIIVSFHPRTFSPAGEKKIDQTPSGKITVLDSSEIINRELIKYLETSKIPLDRARQHCSEILFRLNDKKITAIGFKNDAIGYELRNAWFKCGNSPKASTLIENSITQNIAVLEGFFSFLSFKILQQSPENKSALLPELQYSFLVLNSLSFFERSRKQMEKFSFIHLYLDRNKMGLKRTKEASEWSPKYIDKSGLYKNYKDLNEMLVSSHKKIFSRFRVKE